MHAIVAPHQEAVMIIRASVFAALFIGVGCTATAPATNAGHSARPAILMIVHLKPGLSDDEMDKVLHERAKLFREVPGLIQKYYVREKETGAYSGVYVWDSEESLKAFRESELAKSIPSAYHVTEPPKVEIHRILFPLRE